MPLEAMALDKDQGIRTGDNETVWKTFCGFLDLSLPEFMQIQERLLLEQIETAYRSVLGRQIMGSAMPRTVAEFQQLVRFTTYEDYAPYLTEKNDAVLTEKPYCWAFTSGRSGVSKLVPYTAQGFERLADAAITTMVLACARGRGDNRLTPGLKVIYNMPPKPYYVGYVTQALSERADLRFLPPLDVADKLSFEDKTRESFKLAMRLGVDVVASQTSVLIKMAETFAGQSGKTRVSKLIGQPAMLARVLRGKLVAGLSRRPMLPRDLWSVKAIICYGMDTSVYKDKLFEYWGREPYEVYGSTETGAVAFQTWSRKGLIFNPYSCFPEFVPESEVPKMMADQSYQPRICLLNDLKVGQRYELFATNFYGMPFLRYRMEDIFEVTALGDEETGVNLPHFVFVGRSRDIIDLAGFVQLVEKDFWQAIAGSRVAFEDWTARKELVDGMPSIHMYVEPKNGTAAAEIRERMNAALINTNWTYRDMAGMLRINALRVTVLSQGTFRRYYEKRKAENAPLVRLKPPRMNAPEDTIKELLCLSTG